MKGIIKRFLVCIAAITLCLGLADVVGADVTTKTVSAATKKRTVKVKTYKKTKKYKLKKKAGQSRTLIHTKKKTTTKTSSSVAQDVKQIILDTTKTTTKYKKKKKTKTVTTNRTVKTTTYTTSYVRSGKAKIEQLKGVIDKDVITEFKDSKFTVETNKNSSILRGADGVFSPSRKKIVLKYNIDSIFVHELGHFVDRQNGYTSDSNEFANIYKTEKNKFNGSNKAYAQSSVREFFAEVYKESTFNASKIKKACPKAYAYVQRAENAL